MGHIQWASMYSSLDGVIPSTFNVKAMHTGIVLPVGIHVKLIYISEFGHRKLGLTVYELYPKSCQAFACVIVFFKLGVVVERKHRNNI